MRVLVFGPAAEIEPAPGVEVVDAPVSIAKAADPARAVRATPDASIVQAVRAVADGRADALVSGGSTGAALAAGLFHVKRARGIHRPALAVLVPVPGRAVPAARLRRERRGAARAPRPVRAHGRGVHGGGDGDRAPARGAALQRHRADEGDRGRRRPRTRARRRRGGLAFAGNVEGFAVGTGEADVIVTDGFTGNVFLKVMEGTADTLLRAVREAAMSSARAKAGGLLLRPALAGCATRSTPRRRAARSCSACAGWASSRTARSARTGSRARSSSPRAACAPTWSAGRTSGWPPRARCAARRDAPGVPEPSAATGYGARSMTRDEVLSYIRAHLADELELDPARVEEGTRFKEDLEADSLDLYSLVQELEDTYGVRMSDEEAAQIKTVGQAVDFVLANVGDREPRP